MARRARVSSEANGPRATSGGLERRANLAVFEDRGVLGSLDVELALALTRLGEADDDLVRLGVAFASRAIRRGDVCAELPALVSEPLPDELGALVPSTQPGPANLGHGQPGHEQRALAMTGPEPPILALPGLDAWLAALRSSPLVAAAPEALGGECPLAPLVLDSTGRLYLRRYFEYERTVARAVVARRRPTASLEEPCLEHAALADGVSRLFPKGASDPVQEQAAMMALASPCAVISGGPGTGKTTKVVRLLALLEERAAARGAPLPVVRLLAPTGKATDRLRESVASQARTLDVAMPIKERLFAHARDASTIHRALGFLPRTPTRFRHTAELPLVCDVAVVDEASMVDVALMAKLLSALPVSARVILLGDKDQLASVEAGSVFAELYGLPGASTHLTRSHRYRDDGPIARLSAAVRAGAAADALDAIAGGGPDVGLEGLDARAPLEGALGASVLRHYSWFGTHDPAARLSQLARFRILCTHREGRLGVAGLNQAVEELLRDELGVPTADVHYDGRPILVTENDYDSRLFNGDVGVVCRVAGVAHAFFRDEGQGFRSIAAVRLPAHETAYAMTIHKSQGSEVDEVAVVLPERASGLTSRELVYTGISRAKARVRIYGSVEALRAAIERKVRRASGLRDRLG